MARHLRKFVSSLFVAALCAKGDCLAQAASSRYPLLPAAIADALKAAGVLAAPSDVTLPSALTASVPSPQLTLGSPERSGPTQIRVRVTCAQSGQCLPFMVVADLHNPAAALAAQRQLAPHTEAKASGQGTAGEMLRAGQHATLLLEDERMRISLPVISIDTGAPGAQVRVASLDRKQTFRAVVSAAATVRGVLP